MLHYFHIGVTDLERSGKFYDALLGPMGWRRHLDDSGAIGWGIVKPVFFIKENSGATPGSGQVAFPAKSIPAVRASYEAGMKHGGESVSEPGSAPTAGAGNFAARLRDPDGYIVELTVAPG